MLLLFCVWKHVKLWMQNHLWKSGYVVLRRNFLQNETFHHWMKLINTQCILKEVSAKLWQETTHEFPEVSETYLIHKSLLLKHYESKKNWCKGNILTSWATCKLCMDLWFLVFVTGHSCSGRTFGEIAVYNSWPILLYVTKLNSLCHQVGLLCYH